MRELIEPGYSEIPIYRQCGLLGISRSGYYYCPQEESPLNLHLMNLMDEQYTKMPFYGVEKMTEWLKRQGFMINTKRVRRLLRLMGLEAIYPRKRLSIPAEVYKKYPYLLRDLAIERPDQVWCADITYIRMIHGFLYLVAIMDWFSRRVLSWRLSNTLDAGFCVDALDEALSKGKPEIFNTDQGVQFASAEFTGRLETAEVRISMDGRGRVFDNIMIERLWRSVKYEEVYIKSYETVRDARDGLARYFCLYNTERLHEALGYRTPYEVYFGLDKNNNGQAGLIHLKEPCFLS
jgi:putative transposase